MSLPAARAMASSLLQRADAFRWQRGVTPLSDERLMLAVPAAYVAAVLLLRAALRGRTVPLGPLPALHNCVLMLWSLAMFSGTAAEAWRLSAAGAGAEWLFCLPPGTQVAGRLYWWSYVYYISKAREPQPLHRPRTAPPRARMLRSQLTRAHRAPRRPVLRAAGHRAARAQGAAAHLPTRLSPRRRPRDGLRGALRGPAPCHAPCRAYVRTPQWLEFAQSLQVVALLTNTGVHVLMYSYYLLCSLGQRPGRVFKLFVTNGQIVQFIFRRASGELAASGTCLSEAFLVARAASCAASRFCTCTPPGGAAASRPGCSTRSST